MRGKSLITLNTQHTNLIGKFDKNEQNHLDRLNNIEIKVNYLNDAPKCVKVKLLLNDNQKNTIHKWMLECETIYNSLVLEFRNLFNPILNEKLEAHSYDPDNDPHKINYGNIFMVALNELKLRHNTEFPIFSDWKKLRNLKISSYSEIMNTPNCVMADSIKEFVQNIKLNIKKVFKRNIRFFDMNLKGNKGTKQIKIQNKYITNRGPYPRLLNEIKFADSSREWKNVEHDFTLVYERSNGSYYAHLFKYVSRYDIDDRNEVISLDPGERVMLTGYGLDHVVEIGKDMKIPIMKYRNDIKNINDKFKTLKGKKRIKRRNNYKKAKLRKFKKIRGLVTELHCKTALYLCENYKRIIIPNFSSKKVVSNQGNLNDESKKIISHLAHYKFRQRLKCKCVETNAQYIEVTEEYTTRTCSKCGYDNATIGSSKKFKCPSCNFKCDRDVNAAKNILLKNHDKVFL